MWRSQPHPGPQAALSLLCPLVGASVVPPCFTTHLTGTSEADPLKRADGWQIVRVAPGDDDPNVRLEKSPFDERSGSLCGVASTAPIRYDAIADLDHTRIIRRTLETYVAGNDSTRALDHHPHTEGIPRGRHRRP